MNPVSEDIKDKLVELGEGKFAKTDGGWAIFLVEEPDEPQSTITIFDTEAPLGVQKSYNTNNHFYRSAFQLRVRGATWLGTKKKIDQVVAKLDRIGSFTAADKTKYNNICMDGEPRLLAKDQKGRFIWIIYGVAFRQA